MKKVELNNWKIAATKSEDGVMISVTNTDGTPVHDTEADIGADNELGYRLTSQGIEELYTANGDVNAEQASEAFEIDDLRVSALVDADNHLNLYIVGVDGKEVEQIALTNGTEQSKSCDIELSL